MTKAKNKIKKRNEKRIQRSHPQLIEETSNSETSDSPV